jgi:hypothetical protein
MVACNVRAPLKTAVMIEKKGVAPCKSSTTWPMAVADYSKGKKLSCRHVTYIGGHGARDAGSMTGEAPQRDVIVGRNSKVWRALSGSPILATRVTAAIGHSDITSFPFTRADRVWVFAYSRQSEENSKLLITLERAAVREVVYVSTATTIVTRLTGCYHYPRVKRAAEDEARLRLNARVLTLGLVVADLHAVPPGCHMVTLENSIAQFMLEPRWPYEEGRTMRLFERVEVPFERAWEAGLHRTYDRLQWILRRWPCVLRPFDLLLRAAGIRWYGYVNLSDRLWTTTTS